MKGILKRQCASERNHTASRRNSRCGQVSILLPISGKITPVRDHYQADLPGRSSRVAKALDSDECHIYEDIKDDFREGEVMPDSRPPLPARPIIRPMIIFPPDRTFQPRSRQAYRRHPENLKHKAPTTNFLKL